MAKPKSPVTRGVTRPTPRPRPPSRSSSARPVSTEKAGDTSRGRVLSYPSSLRQAVDALADPITRAQAIHPDSVDASKSNSPTSTLPDLPSPLPPGTSPPDYSDIPGLDDLALLALEYRELVDEISAHNRRLDELKYLIPSLLIGAGVRSVECLGLRVTVARGHSSFIVAEKLLAAGVTADIIEKCKSRVPYNYVTIKPTTSKTDQE